MHMLPPTMSISDKAFAPVSLRENLAALSQAGFTHIHFDRYRSNRERMPEESIREWEEELARSGMKVLDAHGCHGADMELWSASKEQRLVAIDHFIHRLDVTQRLGGDAVVYHVPTTDAIDEAMIDRLLDSLARLEDRVRDRGMKIALENHYRPLVDSMVFPAAFARFDADYLGFTLDPGHGLISGRLSWLLEHCITRLSILHLNDNDTTRDYHWIPMSEGGRVDWDAVTAAIARSPYAKPLQLEVRYPPDSDERHPDFLARAAQSLRLLAEKIAAQSPQEQAEA